MKCWPTFDKGMIDQLEAASLGRLYLTRLFLRLSALVVAGA